MSKTIKAPKNLSELRYLMADLVEDTYNKDGVGKDLPRVNTIIKASSVIVNACKAEILANHGNRVIAAVDYIHSDVHTDKNQKRITI